VDVATINCIHKAVNSCRVPNAAAPTLTLRRIGP
jgi:hypothetical protein